MQNLLQQDVLQQTIVSELGLESAPQNIQQAMVAKLGDILLQRMTVEILKILPEDQHEQFAQLLQSGDIEALTELVATHIPNLETFLDEHVKTELAAIKAGAAPKS